MAEGVDGSVSLSRDSEPFFELHCQPCNRDKINNNVEAYGYCQDCKEYLCRDCYNSHTKPFPCRHHVLLDKDEAPKDPPLPTDDQSSPSDVCTQKCEEHPLKVLKYHCPIHDVVACGVCVTVSHILCGVDYIPDIAKGIGDSDEFNVMNTMLIDSATKVVETIQQSQKNKLDIQKCYDDALSDVQQLRKEINEMIDLLEMKIKVDVGALKLADMNKMDSTIKASNALLVEINEFRDQLNQLRETRQECSLFTKMKSSTEKLNVLKRKIDSYQENNQVAYYEFHRSDDAWDFLNNTNAYGKLVHRVKVAQHSRLEQVTKVKDKYLKLKNPLIGPNPTVTSMVILNQDTLVALDGPNDTIYVFDTHVFERKHSEKLAVYAWDMTRTGRASVAVTAPEQEKIILYSVDKYAGVAKEREIDSSGRCVGIEYCKDMFYVSFNKSAQYSYLAILDSFGVHLKQIDTTQVIPGWNLWILNHIAVHGDSIIVSDYHSVVRVDSRGSGKLQWIYEPIDLDMALGLTVTKKGLILACAAQSNNIHVIASDGKRVQLILSEKDGLNSPRSTAYCESTGRLFVAQFGDDKLKVYETH